MSHLVQIHKQLTLLEQEHGIRILFAIESGSRLWGFESVDSDYDVRAVFAYPKERYLEMRQPVQTINWMSEDRTIDISLHDIRKYMGMLYSGNIQAVEWLRSSIIYREDAARTRLLDIVKASPQYAKWYEQLQGWGRSSWKSAPEKVDIDAVPSYHVKKLLYALRLALSAEIVFDYETLYPLEFSELIRRFSERDFWLPMAKEVGYLCKLKHTAERTVVDANEIPEVLAYLQKRLGDKIGDDSKWGYEDMDESQLNAVLIELLSVS